MRRHEFFILVIKLKLTKGKTFAEWCKENNYEEYIELWDYELNGDSTPFNVSCWSKNKYYFKCRNHNCKHHSEEKILNNFCNGQYNSMRCKQCFSFGQFLLDTFGENGIEDYWDDELNEGINPMEVSRQWNQKVYIKCSMHGSYLVTCSHFYNGTRCPYCKHKSKKAFIDDSLGSLYPKSVIIWSNKNNNSPYEVYPSSNKKAWWKCENGKHDDFFKQINVQTRDGFHCPKCSEEKKNSYLQEKVFQYINGKYKYNILTELDCNIIPKSPLNNRNLPYDNEVEELKLIIEVHGKQHYWEDCSWYKHLAKRNGITAKEEFDRRKWYDEYKEKYALENGYSYLVIPYWTEKDETYKILIDNKIQEVLNNQNKKI